MTMTREQQRTRAREILLAVIAGEETTHDLAERYGVKTRTIRHVAVGRNYPEIYREIMGAEPKVTRSEKDTPKDVTIHRLHRLAQEGRDRSYIATACEMKQDTAKQYLSGRRRADIWEQYNGTFCQGFLSRTWGSATKPSPVFVGGVL